VKVAFLVSVVNPPKNSVWPRLPRSAKENAIIMPVIRHSHHHHIHQNATKHI